MRLARVACLVLLATPLAAQTRAPGLELQLPPLDRLAEEGPIVRPQGLLDEPSVRTLVQSGFPARLRFRAELWREGRVVDALERAVVWDVVLRPTGATPRYEVVQVVGGRPSALGEFRELADAVSAAERPVRPPLRAAPDGLARYYVATVQVEALSVSDLDEVNRWLRGEFEPALRGEREAGPALGRGLRTLAARLLGGDRRRYEARSRSFRASSRTTDSP